MLSLVLACATEVGGEAGEPESLGKALLAALRSADLLPPVLTIECLAASASPDVGCAVLTVTRPVEADELLLELPDTAALTKDSAQDTSLLQYLDPEDGRPPPGMPHWATLPDDFVLALQLLQLQRAGSDRPDDPWGAWLRLAPTQLRGTAHWGEDEREWLAASFMEEHTRLAPAPPHELLQALRAHDAAYFDGDGGAFSPEELDRACWLPLPAAASLRAPSGAGAVAIGAAGGVSACAAAPAGARVSRRRRGALGIRRRSCDSRQTSIRTRRGPRRAPESSGPAARQPPRRRRGRRRRCCA